MIIPTPYSVFILVMYMWHVNHKANILPPVFVGDLSLLEDALTKIGDLKK